MVEPSLQQVANRVAELLIAERQTVAVSESCCGGLIQAALLACPGASRYYIGGHVAYSAQSQRVYFDEALLSDLRAGKLQYGGSEMMLRRARGVRDCLKATWGLAETGQAGPTFIKIKRPEGPYAPDGGGMERTDEGKGIAIFAVAGIDTVGSLEKTLRVTSEVSDRSRNMVEYAKQALSLLEQCVSTKAARQYKL
eukprot:TRINITY_DN30079_c0_g1_i1.p1 TRINITY_DN30079_c0_g1~~TRINITY_DN30079_c0_g1_i1.p1  ORF type:complete len:196 (-),score=37.48 TRINITY_DN30079_c0_g1_i1:24-611(-)